uniref:Uncharacterized protein LOC109549168 isoform X2 n=1 Tax=Tursiops truncatus TaxID=9739 RepID=A0A6J3RYU6_TURTR|nr:uncharacterized protein LOC109549168 isoform X2 [Tursiops truncatus]
MATLINENRKGIAAPLVHPSQEAQSTDVFAKDLGPAGCDRGSVCNRETWQPRGSLLGSRAMRSPLYRFILHTASFRRPGPFAAGTRGSRRPSEGMGRAAHSRIRSTASGVDTASGPWADDFCPPLPTSVELGPS